MLPVPYGSLVVNKLNTKKYMKKLFFSLLAVFCSVVCLTSCLSDDDGSSDAKMSYLGYCDSVVFANDSEKFLDSLVKVGLADLGLIGDKSIFEKDTSINYNSMSRAASLCDSIASKAYKAKFNNVTLDDVKASMFRNMPNSMLGVYSTPSDIPLTSFNGCFSLVSLSVNDKVYGSSFVKNFK
jgi:hypothetical protein